MPARFLLLATLAWAACSVRGVEERIVGQLEQTALAGACAQIADALNETYYVIKTPESEKLCRDLLGRKVTLVGVVEKRPGEEHFYLNLKSAEAYRKHDEREPPPTAQPGQGALPLPPPRQEPPAPKPEEKSAAQP